MATTQRCYALQTRLMKGANCWRAHNAASKQSALAAMSRVAGNRIQSERQRRTDTAERAVVTSHSINPPLTPIFLLHRGGGLR